MRLRQEKRQLQALERRLARLKELHRHLKPAWKRQSSKPSARDS
jgi:hypothetical protein